MWTKVGSSRLWAKEILDSGFPFRFFFSPHTNSCSQNATYWTNRKLRVHEKYFQWGLWIHKRKPRYNSSFRPQFQVHFQVALLLKGKGCSSPVTSVLPERPAKHCIVTWGTESKEESKLKFKKSWIFSLPSQEIGVDIHSYLYSCWTKRNQQHKNLFPSVRRPTASISKNTKGPGTAAHEIGTSYISTWAESSRLHQNKAREISEHYILEKQSSILSSS